MTEFCPLCIKNGCKRKIKLHQINLEEAVWLCEYTECPFPFGYQDFTFVSRRVGEMWSSEWELGKPTALKPSEQFQISLTELGLDTPPVTPGSGSETLNKDSVFSAEGAYSVTSHNLNTNNVIQTKANLGLSKSNSNRLKQSNASECGSISTESTGTRASGEIYASGKNNKSNNRDSKSQELLNGVNCSFNNGKTKAEVNSGFSICDDINLEDLDNRISSSQGFIDACNATEALTESVFNAGKPSKDNLSIHESTVKCTKWLSDNTKSTVIRDHCYTSPEFKKVPVESSKVLSEVLGGRRLGSNRVENSKNKKQLPKVKSIERANVKLAGVVIASKKTSLREKSNFAEQKITGTNTNQCIIVSENSSESCEMGNTTIAIDGLLPINVSYEIPNFVEGCVTVPWSMETEAKVEEENVRVEMGQEPVVNNSVVSVSTKIGAVDCVETKNSQPATSSKTETRIESMKKPLKRPIHKLARYQGFNFGALKKKSKSNASGSEENIKSSLPNVPSPDNASSCSDLTWTSETSCATITTVDSKTESVGSSLDSSSKSISTCADSCSQATSSSDLKIRSPEMDRVLESNFNLDTVLDDLILGDNKDMTQCWEDDWLASFLD